MQIRQFFPAGIAKGKQFINRAEELARLQQNLLSGTHTLLLAPRRFGKSSLARRAIDESGLPFAEIDLFLAINDSGVGQKIIQGVENIIRSISSATDQWFELLSRYFTQAHIKWAMGVKNSQMELIPDKNAPVAENVLEAFNVLEFILKQKQSRAVIFIEEIQEIANTQTGKAIEAAIRHFAQGCEQISFVFSGSNRQMLVKMFKERSRPLYALCDEIHLERIGASFYETYINNVALQTFGIPLEKKVIDVILILSERHPKYVYTLCFEIWLRSQEQPPSLHQVIKVWHIYLRQQQKDVRENLRTLSQTQIKLLKSIASGNNTKLSSHDNQKKLKLTSSAIVQSLQVLEDKDYIEKFEASKYRIIDPVIKGLFLLPGQH